MITAILKKRERRYSLLVSVFISLSSFFSGYSGHLLVITPDDFYSSIQPLVQWKLEKGYSVEVKKLSEIGSTPAQIKDYITLQYNTVGLRYCLLVGAINKIPALPIPKTSVITDYLYGCIDTDLIQDVYIGRLPASNASELDVMISKILSYEKASEMTDTLWFKRALAVATSYVGGTGTKAKTAIETKRWWGRLLQESGFQKIDTVFHDDPPYPTPESITAAVNRGVLFVNGRGWGNYDGWHYPLFYRRDVANLNNGFKLPVVTSLYCATGNFNANPCFGEVWLRAGTPSQPKGGVLFFGPTWASTSTRWNNLLDAAIFNAIFRRRLVCAGEVFQGAKRELVENFPQDADSFNLRVHIQTYNILGDPTLWLWRGVPKNLTPNYPTSLSVGHQRVSISVPGIESAWVCFFQGGRQFLGFTDQDGKVLLDVNPPSEGNITLTISKPDYLPFQVSLPVQKRNLHCGFYSYEISAPTPGQQTLYIDLKNYGKEVAYNCRAIVKSETEKAVVLDSIKEFGNIMPDSIRRGGPFLILIKPDALDKETLNFSLKIQEDRESFYSGFKIEVSTGKFNIPQVRVDDGNNQVLEPGEEANLFVKLKNIGRAQEENIEGRLSLLSNAGVILDSNGSYGSFSPDEEKENQDPFRIRLFSEFSSNRTLCFELRIISAGEVKQILRFSLEPGPYDPTRPLGPSPYGYYAYDDVDTNFTQKPNYSWVEIDPNFGGAGQRVHLGDDGITTLPLPFSFRYFGRNFSEISIAANGYAVLGASKYIDPYNWRIPSPFSPPNLLACFWDDFHPDTGLSSGVYYWNDTTQNRFIIQWSRIHHIHGFITRQLAEQQTFQIILLDPQYYPTNSGDGEIIFQYYFCQNDDSTSGNSHNYATSGILDPTGKEGILITFANRYPKGAEVLRPQRAIKFTTSPPDSFTRIIEKRDIKEIRMPTIIKLNQLGKLLEESGQDFNEWEVYDCLGRKISVRLLASGQSGRSNFGGGLYFFKTYGIIKKIILVR